MLILKKKSPFLKIKTVLWCHQILKLWGITDSSIFLNNKKANDLLVEYRDKLSADTYDLISDPDIKWTRYIKGTTSPYQEQNSNSAYRRILLEVDTLLPGTKNYFLDGPLGTFNVLESHSELEAHRNFALNVKAYCKDYEGFVREADIPSEGFESDHYEWIADWEEIRKELVANDSVKSFRALQGIVGYTGPKRQFYDKDEMYDIHSSTIGKNEESLFWIRLQAAFIDAKFYEKYNQLIELLFINRRGIFYFSKNYGIDKQYWFKSNVICEAFSYLSNNSQDFIIEEYDYTFFKDNFLDLKSQSQISISKLPLLNSEKHKSQVSYEDFFEENFRAIEEWKIENS